MRFVNSILTVAVILCTLATGTASAQYPSLVYGSGAGAVTDINGVIGNPMVTYVDENGYVYNPCPPAEAYGQNIGWLLPPRQTGGDGVFTARDKHGLVVGSRTQTTFALADATRSAVRAFATANVSPPCGGLYPGAAGLAYAEFYDTYTVNAADAGSTVNLEWSLSGTFSDLTTWSGGGQAYLEVSLLTAPPAKPIAGIMPYVTLTIQGVNSLTSLGNVGCSWNGPCGPTPATPSVDTDGKVDVASAFSYATNRALAPGDTFIIRTVLIVSTRACGFPDGCDFMPIFTTDFSATARVTASGAVVRATAYRE